jgi:hypothetical protein
MEVQSALWNRASITLFTAAAITKYKDRVAAFLFSLYENHLFLTDKNEEKIIWSTSHGKGVVSGIGGRTKS